MTTTTSASVIGSTLPPPRAGRRTRLARKLILGAVLLALLAWSWAGSEISAGALFDAQARSQLIGAIADFFDRLLPPDFSLSRSDARAFQPPLLVAGQAVAITLQISILGTAIGALAALGLCFFAAENLTPHWLHHPVRILLAVVRSVPVLLLAILFVGAIGFGPAAGVWAIAIHTVGMLGKLFAEEAESVDIGVWEALDSAGAGWLQKVRYAIWPQVSAQFASLTLFRLDMNLRESAVLGLVGVAGLGLWIENYRRAFDYQSVATMVLATMALVLIVDQLSYHIRKRLR